MEQNIILFGASGFVGNNLYQYFSKQNKLILGTTYKSEKSNLTFFDVENSDLKKLDKVIANAKYAIICSAVTKPDECKKNPEKTYQINVRGTKKLIEQLWEREIFPIWFSSEYVFNGEKGNYTEQDRLCPNTVYGNHKKIIEDFLNRNEEESLILRLGKVFSLDARDKTILTSTLNQLKNDEDIKSATDQIFSPLYIQDLIKIVDISIVRNLRGLYNAVSPEFFSRFQIAKLIKEKLGIETGKISPCYIKDCNFIDNRPLNTRLNPSKLIKDTNLQFTLLEECIKKLTI